MTDRLDVRVQQSSLEDKGRPTRTSLLIGDLWREVLRLREEIALLKDQRTDGGVV